MLSVQPCVCTRGLIFGQILMKLDQNICLVDISDEFEKGSFGGQKLHLVCRSLAQISEKPCVCSRSHIFGPLLMKLGQNICLDEVSDEY